jgi:hypothetical protein
VTHIERFSHFDHALRDMVHWASDAATVTARAMYEIAAEAIRSGGRFYLPEARNVLEERTIDAEAKALIRLPYDCTVVLSETYITDGEVHLPTWKISIAIEPGGEFNHRVRAFRPSGSAEASLRTPQRARSASPFWGEL